MMVTHSSQSVSLDYLLEGLEVMTDVSGIRVTGVSMDSRSIIAGDVFLACAGYRSHGLKFLSQAIERGASVVLAEVTLDWLPEKLVSLSNEFGIPFIAVSELNKNASLIADRFYCFPSQSFPVVGVTGTNGKTSCCQFIAQAYASVGKVAVLGTLGNGFLDDLKTSTHTTMDPVSVQASLAMFKQEQAKMVAMEVSSHALQQGRVANVEFDLAVFTNLSRDHLDYHGTMADYASAKSLLFKMPFLKVAIINADDELGLKLISELRVSPLKIIAYGAHFDPVNFEYWLFADRIKLTSQGLTFSIVSSWGCADLRLSLMGRFNINNALVALAVLLEQGVDFSDAIECLQNIKTVPGRMEMIADNNKPTVVIDFAHTPDALAQALQSLKEHLQAVENAKLICVFGCGGERDKGKRSLMGEVAERLADTVILTNDNPRKETPEIIIEDILQGFIYADDVEIELNREKAIVHAIHSATNKDIVLIAGKGHETFQMQGDLKIPFSDQSVAKEALKLR